jgi:hypothetical protein
MTDGDQARGQILALHDQDRRAHLEGDADLLVSGMADYIWEASRGRLNRLARTDVRDRFAAYFNGVRYTVWDDLVQPHVAVAADGSTAWLAVHIEAALSPRDESGQTADNGPQRTFESSWIATYEKQHGTWLMVGISSSVVDRA